MQLFYFMQGAALRIFSLDDDNISTFEAWARNVPVANAEQLFFGVDHVLGLVGRCYDEQCLLCLKIKCIVMQLIHRIKALPHSEFKLQQFAFYTPRWSLTHDVIREMGRLPRPPAIAVDALMEGRWYCSIGNIMKLYFKRFTTVSASAIATLNAIAAGIVGQTRLIDIGVMQMCYCHPQSWRWCIDVRPQDNLSLAYRLMDGEHVFNLNPIAPQVAYELRVHQDLANSMYNALTWIVLGRSRKECLLSMLHRDCVQLIFSYIVPRDWDFRHEKKRNVTQKRSKYANELIEQEKEHRSKVQLRQSAQVQLKVLQEAYRGYEERRKAKLEVIDALRKKEEETRPNVETYRKKIKRIHFKYTRYTLAAHNCKGVRVIRVLPLTHWTRCGKFTCNHLATRNLFCVLMP